MRKFRRRRARSSWFPGIGQSANQQTWPGWGGVYSHYTDDLTLTGAISYISDIIDLTVDYPPEEAAAAGDIPSLADYEGSAWQLDGIVGAIRCQHVPTIETPLGYAPTRIMAACFFEVLEVEPITGEPKAPLDELTTFANANRRDPFIWQRSWILQAPFVVGTGSTESYLQLGGMTFPNTNVGYESALTGSHIHAKSKRYIGPKERLFGVVEMIQLTQGLAPLDRAEQPASVTLEYDLDIRLLGRLRRASNRRNTSR